MSENAKPFKIDWSSRSKLRGPGERSLGDLLLKLRDQLAPEAEGISITYLDDRAMRKLNREHRGINQTTDILSFPANPEKGAFQHLGDLVVSLPVAEKMAKKLGVSRRREVETLIIHGFLHLCGHDHAADNGEMMALQAKLERELLESEPLLMAVKRGPQARQQGQAAQGRQPGGGDRPGGQRHRPQGGLEEGQAREKGRQGGQEGRREAQALPGPAAQGRRSPGRPPAARSAASAPPGCAPASSVKYSCGGTARSRCSLSVPPHPHSMPRRSPVMESTGPTPPLPLPGEF